MKKNELDYRRIQTGIETVSGEGFVHVQDIDGGMITEWNPYWMERLNDYHNLFVSELEEKIAHRISEDGWKVRFTQISPYPEKPPFFVDIYVSDISHYSIVADIVLGMTIADSLDLRISCKPFQ